MAKIKEMIEAKVPQYYNQQLRKVKEIERKVETDLVNQEYWMEQFNKETRTISRYIKRIQTKYEYEMCDNEVLEGLYL